MTEITALEAPPFRAFAPIARLRRDIVVTEKLDGTNAQVHITEDGRIFAGSRNRWITTFDDNYGFAAWVQAHREELLALGPGSHFGEWWGAGIRRRYSIGEKRFSLFNVGRWADDTARPRCCHVVPTLYVGPFSSDAIENALARLAREGSVASPGFMDPEGIVVWHEKARVLFKATLDGDGHKGAKAEKAA